MKKSKLTLEKFRIVELKNSSHFFGGTGTNSSDCDSDTNPHTGMLIEGTAFTRTDNDPDITVG